MSMLVKLALLFVLLYAVDEAMDRPAPPVSSPEHDSRISEVSNLRVLIRKVVIKLQYF